MKTVAIATIGKDYLLTNYGSFFQHYALRLVLKRFGYKSFRLISKFEISSLTRMFVEQLKDWLRPLYWQIKGLPDRQRIVQSISIRNKTYWKFLFDYFRLIGDFNEKPLYNRETIGIRGGDQVLLPDSDERWFSKIQENKARITYAASTDWHLNGFNQEWRVAVASRLKTFSAIGIREYSGVCLMKELLSESIPVQHVADPVQLLRLDDFLNIQSSRRVFVRPTLFCYLVNIRSEEDLCLDTYERLAELLNCELKFVGIQGGELFIPRRYRVLYSPRQFLRALNDAKYFITNSYHGSVLAIQYQKRFLSIWQNCLPGTNQNERQKELMYKFRIEDHWVDYKLSADEWKRILEKRIDWDSVNHIAEEWRSFSLNWLKKAIGE